MGYGRAVSIPLRLLVAVVTVSTFTLLFLEELVERLRLTKGSRLDIKIGENYVDYIISDVGDYAVLMGARKGAKIRFPLSYRGYVLIKPRSSVKASM